MQALIRDLNFGIRQLRKSPGFTRVAILTLTLGVGANAVVFSAINSLVLHRLPIARADRVFFLERLGGTAAQATPFRYIEIYAIATIRFRAW